MVKIEVRRVMEAQVACSVDGFDLAFRDPKRVSFGGRSAWQLHSNVPKYEVAGAEFVKGRIASRDGT